MKNHIEIFRKAYGYNQQDLARFLNVDRSTISLYENGRREVPLLILNKLCDLFYCGIDELIYGPASPILPMAVAPEDMVSIAHFNKVINNYLTIKMLCSK